MNGRSRDVNVPEYSEAKIRNGMVVLRAHFAKPDTYTDEGWEVHLREVAKLLFTIAAVGRR